MITRWLAALPRPGRALGGLSTGQRLAVGVVGAAAVATGGAVGTLNTVTVPNTGGSASSMPAPRVAAAWPPSTWPATFTCAHPVTVFYNPSRAPEPAAPDLTHAVAVLAAASHRALLYGGQTQATDSGQLSTPTRPAILVRWVPTPAELPGSPTADTLAVGGGVSEGTRLLSGYVDIAAQGHVPDGSGPGDLQTLAEHELLHSLGVDSHSPSTADLMYPVLLPTRGPQLGRGDRQAAAETGCSNPTSSKGSTS